MKYVYVLTSCENDFYYEQFFISATSLRLHNPQAFIIAIIDSKTKKGLTGKRSGYEQVVSQTIIVPAPETLSQKKVARWIKTSLKKFITGDFLFIDCDTVITADLNHDFPHEINIGAVLDTHVLLSSHHLSLYFEEQRKIFGGSLSFETGKYFNSGILFCRDSPISGDFFQRWHSLWLLSCKNGIHQDQPSLNQASHEMGGLITEMEGEWNCQITHNGLPFLVGSKIIHCFATSMKSFNCPFLPASIPVLSYVKNTGIISSELTELLKNPKAAFERDSRIISGQIELDTINSKIFSLLLFFRKKTPRFFKALNSLLLKTRARTQK